MNGLNIIKKVKEFLKIVAVIVLLIILSVLLYANYNITAIATTESSSTVPSQFDDGIQENVFRFLDSFSKQVTVNDFNWEKDVDESIGKITLEDNGRKVNMTGNETLEGKNAIYIIPENHQQQVFGFHYNVEYGDSFYAAGLLMRVKKDNEYLTGYMLSFNNTSRPEWTGEYSTTYGSIWKFKYKLHDNRSSNIEKELVKDLNIPQSGNIQIDSTAEEIKITGEVNETITINQNDQDVGDGFGFFTAHYSHNCDRIGNFDLTNFAVTTIDIIPHKLIVDPNGGTWGEKTEKSELTGVYEDTANIPMPEREGYTFVGWTKEGSGGEMSTLTDTAVYTWGENETDDKITAQWVKTDLTKQQSVSEVTNGTEITYTLRATNSGTVKSKAIISDTIPAETTFVDGSITLNGQATQNTQENLQNGIEVEVPAGGSTTITFKVISKDLEDKQLIKNIAKVKDITVESRIKESQSQEVVAKYLEPIISQTKEISTQNGKDYVIAGENVKYTIVVNNAGGLAKDVLIQDTVPAETTFVDGSIKVDDQAVMMEGNQVPTKENLADGITIQIPAYSTKRLSFDVTVNDVNNKDVIKNIAKVDNNQTNEVAKEYIEPIISQTKEIATANGENYVVKGEKITYTITINNDGDLGKDVTVKDPIPEGTTFVEDSIKLDGQTIKKEDGNSLTKDDLTNGIVVGVEGKSSKKISFDVTVNDINNKDVIKNIAEVDNNPTNEVDKEYIEPIISQTKEISTANGENYVVKGEKITYTIIINNDGDLGKDVTVKDQIPEGTTFMEDSIKLDGQAIKKEDGKSLTKEDLANGIVIGAEGKSTKKLSFEVVVNAIKDESIIENIATVDGIETNKVTTVYSDSIISEYKKAETQYGKEYVVGNEKITYKIIVKNTGTLPKLVVVKDAVPNGTTFVEGSIRIDGESGKLFKETDLEKGIEVLVPAKPGGNNGNQKEKQNTDKAQNDNSKGIQKNNSGEVNININDEKLNLLNIDKIGSTEENESQNQYEEVMIPSEYNDTKKINVPPFISTNTKESKDTQDEQKGDSEEENQDNQEFDENDANAGFKIISFEVTVNPLEKDTDTARIDNIALIDDMETNEVSYDVYPFNMKIEQKIKNLILNGAGSSVGDGKTAKTEVYRKAVNSSKVTTTYEITVTNTGKVPGTATVKDIIPTGYKVADNNPTYWSKGDNGEITTTTKELEAGESQKFEVSLVWINGKENFGEKINEADIADTKNDSNAEETTLKDNQSQTDEFVTVSTGAEKRSFQIMSLIMLPLFMAMVVGKDIIDKKRARQEIDLKIFHK